jgi:hypothetical protein
MLLRPTHSRVIMPAPITGRDSTAQYNAVRGPTAAWRAVARADLTGSDGDLSFRSRLLPPDDQDGNEESPATAMLTDRPSMPHICGLDFEAYATRGIRLERTQTLARGAGHCNFRFSRLEPK